VARGQGLRPQEHEGTHDLGVDDVAHARRMAADDRALEGDALVHVDLALASAPKPVEIP